ncbi:unnamed protein product, partial [Owenia fusiformis]
RYMSKRIVIVGLLTGLLVFVFRALVYEESAQTSWFTQRTATEGTNGHVASGGTSDAAAVERILVLYAYFESPERKANLQFFLDFAIKDTKNIDYVIIANGFTCTADIPTQDNVHVIKRENNGFDACAWKQGLEKMKREKGENWYKYVFFMNASVRGPFLPTYLADQDWTSLFTKHLSEDIKLVGTSICCPHPRYPKNKLHLQSMFLLTDLAGLRIVEPMLQCGYTDKQSVIDNVEVKLSQAFIEAGYNIASMLKRWEGHDFRDEETTRKMCKHDIKGKRYGDPYFQNLYFSNINISPFEVIFFKTNRRVNNDLVNAYTQMMYEQIKNKLEN